MQKSLPSDEKFTPKIYIRSVKKVFGGTIDLDPASSEIGNKRIGATHFYSLTDDGLNHNWHGKVFLNPPYSKGNLIRWTNAILEEYEIGITTGRSEGISEGILLVPNWTDAKWFQALWHYPICFTDHRIRYYIYNEFNGKFYIAPNPEGGSCFVYFGKDIYTFAHEFEKHGHIVNRYKNLRMPTNVIEED